MTKRKTASNKEVAKATLNAETYIVMRNQFKSIWRTVEINDLRTGRGQGTNSYGYKQTLDALWRLKENGIVGQRTVGDAGNIWWLRERVNA